MRPVSNFLIMQLSNSRVEGCAEGYVSGRMMLEYEG